MKKLTSILLALVMCLGMCSVVFAEGVNGTSTVTVTNGGTFTLDKTYTVTGTSPAETFSFAASNGQVTGSDATDALTSSLSITSVEFDGTKTETKQATVTLPTYTKVGTYTYTITETASNADAAGLTTQSPLTLKVYVVNGDNGLECKVALLNGESKTTGFTDNKYESGSLAVKKIVTGNMGDKNKEFNVTVTFTAPEGEAIDSTISYTENGQTKTVTNNTATIALKDQETITFTNIPEGVTYTVVEADYTGTNGGYDTASYEFSDEKKTISAGDEDTANITNRKGAEVDTGVNMDSVPYMMIFGVVVLGAAVVLAKKKFSSED